MPWSWVPQTRFHMKGRKQQAPSCSSETEVKLTAKFPSPVAGDLPHSSFSATSASCCLLSESSPRPGVHLVQRSQIQSLSPQSCGAVLDLGWKLIHYITLDKFLLIAKGSQIFTKDVNTGFQNSRASWTNKRQQGIHSVIMATPRLSVQWNAYLEPVLIISKMSLHWGFLKPGCVSKTGDNGWLHVVQKLKLVDLLSKQVDPREVNRVSMAGHGEPSKAEPSACAFWEEAVHCQPRSQPEAYLIYLSQSFLGKNGQLRRPAY